MSLLSRLKRKEKYSPSKELKAAGERLAREWVIGFRKGADGENYHEYLSTACWHLEKENCRLECKYCSSPCICDCHKGILETCGMSMHVVTRVNVIGIDRDAAGYDSDDA